MPLYKHHSERVVLVLLFFFFLNNKCQGGKKTLKQWDLLTKTYESRNAPAYRPQIPPSRHLAPEYCFVQVYPGPQTHKPLKAKQLPQDQIFSLLFSFTFSPTRNSLPQCYLGFTLAFRMQTGRHWDASGSDAENWSLSQLYLCKGFYLEPEQ